MLSAPSRAAVIALLDQHKKRDDFMRDRRCTPETYFEENFYLEPGIWTGILQEYEIPLPESWTAG